MGGSVGYCLDRFPLLNAINSDCDDVPDAPQQRETDPRAAEVAHLSEKLRQAEDLQAGLL